METVTLTGYLGRDPEFRNTRARISHRTLTRSERFVFLHGGRAHRDGDDVYEETVEVETHHSPRGYATLSIATHDRRGRTTWHRIIAWNTDREHRTLRWCRSGSRVSWRRGITARWAGSPSACTGAETRRRSGPRRGRC